MAAVTEPKTVVDSNEETVASSFFARILQMKPKFKPFNPHNLYTYYMPIVGAVSYSAFSVTVFLPDISVRAFTRHSLAVANSLLFNAHLGSGFYLYWSSHLRVAPLYHRIMYSVYGSLIFNFGSVLLWAVTKSILPDSRLVRAIFALSSSLCMLTVGKEYVDYVDARTRNPL